MGDVKIRPVTAADAERVDELCGQLGYETSIAKVRARIAKVATAQNSEVFVAEEDGMVQGWIQVTIRSVLESGEFAEITGLVVDESLRGKGIGRKLVVNAEAWAKDSGHTAIRVRTNILRSRTLGFYRKLGFKEIKQQVVFRKEI